MILCDAGVLLCLVDHTQSQHNAYRTAVQNLAKPLTTTWSCLTEAMYLAFHRGGWAMQKQLGQLLLDNLIVCRRHYPRPWFCGISIRESCHIAINLRDKVL
ncbi:hypothetical protein GlitD10_2309 [Gloeomargarita lithophora Alchichica-D10]|uniref:PIN domain-containing protein n=1 Tax=Gloeomargarita lithophora Alchichica-D10 TaxID=1188229 RepID=A0A1J0AFG7_9CYAN|nr:hypothetical protein GlitD10_2309 [Gloeomargarita lithophora Alchichica-D10]